MFSVHVFYYYCLIGEVLLRGSLSGFKNNASNLLTIVGAYIQLSPNQFLHAIDRTRFSAGSAVRRTRGRAGTTWGSSKMTLVRYPVPLLSLCLVKSNSVAYLSLLLMYNTSHHWGEYRWLRSKLVTLRGIVTCYQGRSYILQVHSHLAWTRPHLCANGGEENLPMVY